MAHWSVIGTGRDGGVEGKTFGLTLDTDKNTWTAGGSSANSFCNDKSGSFKIVGVPENGTQCVNADKEEVFFLKGLNGTTAVKGTGTGRASQKGVNFDWLLDSK